MLFRPSQCLNPSPDLHLRRMASRVKTFPIQKKCRSGGLNGRRQSLSLGLGQTTAMTSWRSSGFLWISSHEFIERILQSNISRPALTNISLSVQIAFMNSLAFQQIPFLKSLRQSKLRMVFAWLLIVALLMRGFMPAGFMPDIGRVAGAFPIKICSSYGIKTILVSALEFATKGQNTVPSEEAMHKHHDCLLCAAPVQVTGDAPSIFLHMVLFFAIALTFISWLGVTRRRYEAAAAPRAPPAIS